MKKTRILAVLLAAVLLFAAIPVTVGADSEKGGIVKDVVDFDGSYVTSESYFALGSSLYDKDGNKLFTLENENEVIYTLTDNCIITVVGDSDFTDLVSLELSFKLGNSKNFRSSAPGTRIKTKYIFIINHNITEG